MLTVKYTPGLRIKLEDGTVINVRKPSRGLYQVEGFYGTNYGDKYLDLFYSNTYSSLKGVGNYLQKNFNINLIY